MRSWGQDSRRGNLWEDVIQKSWVLQKPLTEGFPKNRTVDLPEAREQVVRELRREGSGQSVVDPVGRACHG